MVNLLFLSFLTVPLLVWAVPVQKRQAPIIQSTGPSGYLSRIFPINSLNMPHMANLAMNPMIDNHTLIELFREASEIINATGADCVLMEMDSVLKNTTANQNLTKILSEPNGNLNNSVIVLAVNNPTVPSHADLMNRFNLYFVNLTEQPSLSSSFANKNLFGFDFGKNTGFNSDSTFEKPTMWKIFIDFVRNQANALIGAFYLPINVSANAILKSAQQHAEFVMQGSSFGTTVSTPIILKSVSIPNTLAQRVIDVTSQQTTALNSMEQKSKQLADSSIQSMVDGLVTANDFLNNSTENFKNVTRHYVIRPVGAFTGFQLNQAGTSLANLGQSLTLSGLRIHLIGDQLYSGALKVVSGGATAVAWGLDDTVSFEQPKLSSLKNSTMVH